MNSPVCSQASVLRNFAAEAVLLIDDHALFRAGLRLLLLALCADLQVEEADTIDDALPWLGSAPKQALCLLDLDLRQVQGLETLHRFRAIAPNIPAVVVSAHEEPGTIRACIDCGAMGFVPKSATSDALLAALQRILAGAVYVPECLFDAYRPSSSSALPISLSPRQGQVLMCLTHAMSTKSIAAELGISEHTVKEYLAEIYRMLGVHSRTEAVIRAGQMHFPAYWQRP